MSFLAEEQKQRPGSALTEELRPGDGGSYVEEGLRRGTGDYENSLHNAPRIGYSTRTMPTEVRTRTTKCEEGGIEKSNSGTHPVKGGAEHD